MTTLKIVYYGAPFAGKTTNLESISTSIVGNEAGRLTPRHEGENRIASVEVTGLIGSSVRARLETMQGEVSGGGGGWSRMFAEADGIVFVADSSPRARTSNVKAIAALRETQGKPVVIQWSKRDLDDARPVAELEMELNHRCLPAIEAAALRGMGVAETLVEILKRTLKAVQKQSGGLAMADAELARTLAASIQQLSQAAREALSARYGSTIEAQTAGWQPVREAPVRYEGIEAREAIFVEDPADRATRMFAALERVTRLLGQEGFSGLPYGLMARLLEGCDRRRGSLLLFAKDGVGMETREAIPPGTEPPPNAASICSRAEPQGGSSAWVVPLVFGSRSYGGMVVDITQGERAPESSERDYWKTAAAITSAHLAGQAANNRTVVSRPTEPRTRPVHDEQLKDM